MYSSLQQQCLVELGITPFDLNDKYKTPAEPIATTEQVSIGLGQLKPEPNLESSGTQTRLLRPKPVKAHSEPNATAIPAVEVARPTAIVAESTRLTQPAPLPKTTAAAKAPMENHWLNCSDKFIADIKVVFPQIALSVLAFDAMVALLQEQGDKKVYWKIASKFVTQYVQLESIGQDTVITSPLPNELSPAQKKELWLLLQPYAPQPAQTNQATQTIREN
ncbi:hypothetical protein [uncultured Psychrosphaera sp.]|uniref:hypothetical protein n=1 Tax=uncultured Psychrosphaera sp. TaxID=1403522 RepID=UPI002601E1C8|nr:hypothetical protein [uncultured Psychrosphaera sp.]